VPSSSGGGTPGARATSSTNARTQRRKTYQVPIPKTNSALLTRSAPRPAPLCSPRHSTTIRDNPDQRELRRFVLPGNSLTDRPSNKEIAARLHIQMATVKNHAHHVLAKMQVRGRAEAAARYRQHLGSW
jgi:Bacterial regulatory proteins, luxR family